MLNCNTLDIYGGTYLCYTVFGGEDYEAKAFKPKSPGACGSCTMEQIDIKAAKAIVENIEKIK